MASKDVLYLCSKKTQRLNITRTVGEKGVGAVGGGGLAGPFLCDRFTHSLEQVADGLY